MELFCKICSDMIDDKDTNMYKSVLYGSRQFFFCIMHPFVIISYIIVFDVYTYASWRFLIDEYTYSKF